MIRGLQILITHRFRVGSFVMALILRLYDYFIPYKNKINFFEIYVAYKAIIDYRIRFNYEIQTLN